MQMEEDKKYFYKSVDNYVVLKLPIMFKPTYDMEAQEIYVSILIYR